MTTISLKDELIAYKNNAALRAKYLDYITDMNIPLADRWEVFVEAPYEFQEHRAWCFTFETERMLPSKEINWYEDFGVERCNTVYSRDLIEGTLPMFLSNIFLNDPIKAQLVLEAFRIEILDTNLGSFVYDW